MFAILMFIFHSLYIYVFLTKELQLCRGGGIRTPGTLRYAGFQDQCIRPLCHSSIYLYICLHGMLVTRLGLEPRMTGPKPVVLPLHHRAIKKTIHLILGNTNLGLSKFLVGLGISKNSPIATISAYYLVCKKTASFAFHVTSLTYSFREPGRSCQSTITLIFQSSLILFVPRDGLEPSRAFSPTDFKSVVSTNSTTMA